MTKIAASQAAGLQNLVKAAEQGLRELHPKIEWFQGMPPPDRGTILVITWDDAELAFALPPQQLRSRLPEDAKATYKQIDEISRSVAGLASSYVETAQITDVDDRDPRIQEFQDRLDQVLAISEPKNRVGW